MTDRWERSLRALGCAALIAALAYRIVESGPLRLEAPRTAGSKQPSSEHSRSHRSTVIAAPVT